MSQYPAQLDDVISLPTALDNITGVNGTTVNRLRDAILAIEFELGVKPSGIYSTVKNRLDTLENIIASQTISGDVVGAITASTVIKLQGRSVAASAPANGNVLTWVQGNTDWEPRPPVPFSSITNLNANNTITLNGNNDLVFCAPGIAGACIVNAPSLPINTTFTVKDANGGAGTNILTISGNGNNIESYGNPGNFATTTTINKANGAGVWAWDPGNARFALISRL